MQPPLLLLLSSLTLSPLAAAAQPSPAAERAERDGYCRDWAPERFTRNPSSTELRCRHNVNGPGRFGLLSYVDVPVYQPATPMPGTHLAGVPGHARPEPGESYEEWEWRVLRTTYGPEAQTVHRELHLLEPLFAGRIIALERRLQEEGIRAVRRETWRSWRRQAFIFQQGRSRPGALATTTLTSWHGQVDPRGNPAGRAVDYSVAARDMERFHEIAGQLGLSTFGADSHDPGHVFSPDEQALEPMEIQLLRLLPRVPEVTLATGLPVDRLPPLGGRQALQEMMLRFVDAPFVPFLVASMARAPNRPDIVRTYGGQGENDRVEMAQQSRRSLRPPTDR